MRRCQGIQVRAKFGGKREAIEVSRKMIGSPVEVELGYVRRPFRYVDEESTAKGCFA
jgi:hypothetical protein